MYIARISGLFALLLVAWSAPFHVDLDPALAQSADDVEATAAAYQYSVMESQADFERLYDQMHPDAQIVIPRGAVVYWYATYFAPLGPHPAVITGIRFVDWTWTVNGRTYSNTAEITFQQSFDNQAPISDVVRLVKGHDGNWHWFFGRSADFVQEIEYEAVQAGYLRSGGTVAQEAGMSPQHLFGEALSALLATSPSCFVGETSLNSLPLIIQGDARRQSGNAPSADHQMLSYISGDRWDYPVIIVNVIRLGAGESPESRVAEIEQAMANWNGPPYSSPPQGLARDLAPSTNYLVTYYEEFTEPLGHVPALMWGVRGGSTLVGIAGPAGSAINEVVSAWAMALRSSNPSCAASLSGPHHNVEKKEPASGDRQRPVEVIPIRS
jgi:hypothetical protein